MLDAAQGLSLARKRAIEAAGGWARLQVIVILGAVLGTGMADAGTLSAISDELKHAFGIGNTQIGLLLAVMAFTGVIATLPMGLLADRFRRQRILVVTIALWAAVMLLSGFATSYTYLLVTRMALGAVTAASWPCIASLTGDFFPAEERARIYGLIIAGEMIGVGVGYVLAGEISNWLGWRGAFFAMAFPPMVLVWVLWRYLPEPQRGCQSWLRVDDEDPAVAAQPHHADQATAGPAAPHAAGGAAGGEATGAIVQRVRQQGIAARKELILTPSQAPRSSLDVLVYLLRLPTYGLLIAASSLAYYFFAGVRAFSMLYFTQHYRIPRGSVAVIVFAAGICALVGVIAGGRLSEHLLRRGRLSARIIVPASALFLSIPLLGGGIWTTSPWIAALLLSAGAAVLAAAIPPLDAARLDIVPASMWGRGEAGRMTLRNVFEGGAPLLFGAMSGWLGGGEHGLQWTFIVMLVPMGIAGVLALPALRTYPRDVATAAATAENLAPAANSRPGTS
ncbi:MAG TPA: MFS transporter [Steroidobacteraceae bacterium]